MIRLTLLSTAFIVVGIYAWKDWYKSLCTLIVMMAFLGHHDVPRRMFDIEGLNPWHLVLLVIILAWLAQRKRERLGGYPPRAFVLLLIAFLGILTTAFVHLMFDRQALPFDASTGSLIGEYLVNPVKWIVPGLLLFDGCRSRSRFLWGLVSILSLYVLLSVQVIRWMPIDALASRDALVERSQQTLRREIGYHRVDLSVILAGASWGLFAAGTLVVSRSRRMLVLIPAGVVVLAQALTGGRGGYLAWVVVGLSLSLIRWRWCLLLAPALAIAISVIPGVADRALEGLSERTDTSSSEEVDMDKLTAGRTSLWPLVIDKIAEAPLLGHGRAAMDTTGLSYVVSEEEGGERGVDNPHSAYFEMLLDSGLVGLAVTLAFFGYVVGKSLSLVSDRRSPLFAAIGGLTSALVIAQLVGSITGQSFFPREGTLGMWCAIGLMMRVSVERARANRSFAMHEGAIARAIPTRPAEWWRPEAASRARPASETLPGPVPASSSNRSMDAPL